MAVLGLYDAYDRLHKSSYNPALIDCQFAHVYIVCYHWCLHSLLQRVTTDIYR